MELRIDERVRGRYCDRPLGYFCRVQYSLADTSFINSCVVLLLFSFF